MRILQFKLVVLLIFITGFTQAQLIENQFNTGKECIILINSEAFEVLLSPTGEVLKIFKELPGYMPTRHEAYYVRVRRVVATNEGTTIVEEIVKVEEQPNNPIRVVEKPPSDKLKTIIFDYNSATLSAQDFQTLNEIVNEVKSGGTSLVRINSYDNLQEKNADLLARNRANACKTYLLIKGVGLDRIQVRVTSLEGAQRKVTLELW